MAKVQNGEEILPKALTPGVHEHYRRQMRLICNAKDPNVM